MAYTLTVAEVLERAADLIKPEGAWTQGALGRGEDGARLDSEFMENAYACLRRAVCFCASGAICKAARGNDSLWISGIRRLVNGGSIAEWNDAPGRTQSEVVAALREAAAKAREQGL